ncbi:MAG TPA: glycosyltransferase family 2 protein, partial [Thauera aminoaromatica]|nr:glycosyltransferase family 2 protein [Thauera aminoaromatica]
GRTEGSAKRGSGRRIPPPYLIAQWLRALGRAAGLRLRTGADHSLRMEMNAAYFCGFLLGWMRDRG